MPFIRCMHFDEDGKPNSLRGCTKGSSCPFVHPDQPDWEKAPISKKARTGSSRNDSKGDTSRSFSGSRNDWNTPSTSSNIIRVPESSNKWNSSTETVDGKQAKISWSASKNTEHTHSWGTGPSDASGSGWGQSTGGWESSKGPLDGWGTSGSSNVQPSGWGSDAPVSWGTQDSALPDASAAWPTTSSGGWDSVGISKISSWSSSMEANATSLDKGKEKERATNDVVMRNPSPPRRRMSPQRQDYHQSQLKQSDLPQMKTDLRWSQSPSQPPASPVSATQSLIKEPVPSTHPSPAQESLKKRALELAAIKTAQETGKIYPHENSSLESPVFVGPKAYEGPRGLQLLFTDLISYMQDLVISEIFLRRADAEEQQWKRTQFSEFYAHASPHTRNALDSHRQTLKHKASSASKNRDNALRALLDLPDFAPRRNLQTRDVEETKKVVASYAAELRSWLMELQLHKHFLVKKSTKEEFEVLGSKTTFQGTPGQDRGPIPVRAAELLKRGSWTWKELKDALNIVEQQMDTISEQVYSDMCIRFPLSEIDRRISEQATHLQAQEVGRTIDLGAQNVDSSLQTLLNVGENLRAEAENAAALYKKMNDMQDEITMLVQEKSKMDEICAQAEKQFQVFDDLNRTQEAKIKELSLQLQKLYLHKRPSLRPAQSVTPLAPLKMDGLVEYIRPIVLRQMEADLAPFFMMMRKRVLENQDEVAKELDKLVKPVMDMTEEICQKAMSMNVAQVSAQVSVANQ